MSTKESADSSYENCAADKRCRSDVQPLFGGSCPLLRARSACYFPPADERKGKTKAESDRHLGKSTVTHWSHALPRSSRHDGGVKAEKRRRHEDYWRGALGVRTLGELTSEKYTERMDFRFAGV